MAKFFLSTLMKFRKLFVIKVTIHLSFHDNSMYVASLSIQNPLKSLDNGDKY